MIRETLEILRILKNRLLLMGDLNIKRSVGKIQKQKIKQIHGATGY